MLVGYLASPELIRLHNARVGLEDAAVKDGTLTIFLLRCARNFTVKKYIARPGFYAIMRRPRSGA
jgi:hypothetical protein